MGILECFSGGTQPGSDAGGGSQVPVTGFVGAFQIFTGTDPQIHLQAALLAGSLGNIGVLLGGGSSSGIVGIWQKIGASALRLVSPLWLYNINVANPSLIIGIDIIVVWGSAPSWVSSPVVGLLLAQGSHAVIVSAGTWDGSYWTVIGHGQARANGPGAGSYFGAGLASATNTQGFAGLMAIAAGNWYRANGDGELAINTSLAVRSSFSVGQRDQNLALAYASYPVVGTLQQTSAAGSTTHDALMLSRSTAAPYDINSGPSGSAYIGSAYTVQDNTDHALMLVSHNGGSGTVDWLVESVEFSRAAA